MRHFAMLGLLVVSSIGLGFASIQLQRKMQPPRLAIREMIAIRRFEAHEAAKARNDKAREVCVVERDVRPISFGLLYGLFPATMGPAIDVEEPWHRIGDFTTTTERRGGELVEARVTVSTRPSQCSPSDDTEVFCPFRCRPDPVQDCIQLGSQLHAVWGDRHADENIWRDRANNILARIVDSDECVLLFQRYVDPSRWIAMTTTAEIPLALIGEPRARLDALAARFYYDSPRWPLLVTGTHMLDAYVEFETAGERIVGLRVVGSMEEAGGADELHALVRPYLGRIPIRLDTYGTRFELTIGALD